MRIRLFTFFIILGFSLNAQITIVNADLAQAGDTMRYSVAASFNNYEKAGANQTWDFSKIAPSTQDIQRYYSPTSTPYFIQFFTASYGLPEQLDLLPIGGLGFASNVFGFYRSNNSALVNVGKGATIQNLPIGIVYSKRDTIFKYPLNFGNIRQGNYEGSANLLGLGGLVQTGTRKTEVDGWGSITTPYGTFNCIRVKSEVDGIDSISINGFGIPIPNSRTEYYWFGKNQKFPLMEVIVNNFTQVTKIRYKDVYRPELYKTNARFTASRTTCTTKDTITLNNQSLGSPTGNTWTITPNTFRYVGSTNNKSENPRILFDALGKYSIRLAVTYNGGFDDTTRTDYISVSQGLDVDFEADKLLPSMSETVTITDKTTGNPVAWQWTFIPSTGVQFVESTNAFSQNPKVKFSNKGSYSVRLRATNAAGNFTLTKENYIQVWPTSIGSTIKTFSGISFFPNPVKDFIQLENGLNQPIQVTIYNLHGEEILQETLAPRAISKVLVQTTTPGLYLIESRMGEQRVLQKLIIE
jgi:PKD repeat protein